MVNFSNGTSGRLAGLDINKIKLLMDDMNFTAVWHSETQYGIWNGSEWNGLIKGLQTKTYNMTVNPITVTQQRSKAISFSFPTEKIVVRLYVQRPMSYTNNCCFWAIEIVFNEKTEPVKQFPYFSQTY